jgi:hypothetical protein
LVVLMMFTRRYRRSSLFRVSIDERSRNKRQMEEKKVSKKQLDATLTILL